MINLKTNYLGLELKNPIIIGASNLVSDIENLKAAEKAGAAAIVYKSLFEEQIQLENFHMDNQMEEYNERNAEMVKLFPDMNHAGPQEHLHKLRKAKEAVGIPVIASLNAVYHESWIEFAKLIEDTGVDAIELNFYSVPKDFTKDEKEITSQQLAVVKEIKKTLNIPVSVKLSPYYTNILQFISDLDKTGVDGLVLFNRMFQPDIDLEKEEHFSPFNLSSENDHRLALRFAGLLSGRIKANICSSSGIMTGKDVLKSIMAGADCVQVVSTLYKHKISHIADMLEEMNEWMKSKKYNSLKDFKGKLSEKNTKDPFVYKRAQYIDLLLKSEDLLKTYSLR
ncbi:MAG: dihydroorotate dehydrogenase-like protein [Bacteroidales bacterium]|nr:dihydroorotate dehydrogenase-like protein [Bacteroidales bacterium]